MNIRLRGGQVLSGEVVVSGSKNSAVALIPATILFSEPVTLQNIPPSPDTKKLVGILQNLGSLVNWDTGEAKLTIDNSRLNAVKLGFEDFGNMRGSVLLWGP